MKCFSNGSLMLPAVIGLIILVLLNLVGDYYYDYNGHIWWQNWFPAYAAIGSMLIVATRKKCRRCQ